MIVAVVIQAYIELIDRLVVTLLRLLGLVLPVTKVEPEGDIDERIAKIDAARKNLLDGINAIDDLKKQAEENKKESVRAMQQITQLQNDKASLSEEVDAIKEVIQADVNAFRKVAGIPSKGDVQKGRIIGFISGVIASLIAAGIICAIVNLVTYITS